MRLHWFQVLVLAATALIITGCPFMHKVEEYPCPATVGEALPANSGDFLMVGGKTIEAPSVFATGCEAYLSLGEVAPDSAGDARPTAVVVIECGDNGEPDLRARIGDIYDVAEEQALDDVGEVTIEYWHPADAYDEIGYRCQGTLSQPTVTILEATGTAAPYPDVVTEDFRRVVRVQYEDPQGEPSGGGHGCEYVSARFDLTFEITRADYQQMPDRICEWTY